jgi:hypothetical protein
VSKLDRSILTSEYKTEKNRRKLKKALKAWGVASVHSVQVGFTLVSATTEQHSHSLTHSELVSHGWCSVFSSLLHFGTSFGTSLQGCLFPSMSHSTSFCILCTMQWFNYFLGGANFRHFTKYILKKKKIPWFSWKKKLRLKSMNFTHKNLQTSPQYEWVLKIFYFQILNIAKFGWIYLWMIATKENSQFF